MDRLRDRGEQALLDAIRRLIPRSPRVPVGPGDDAAVLAPVRGPLLVTTDAMVEHVHFERAWLSPRLLGRRAFEVSASDVAAMGGRVVAAVLAVTVTVIGAAPTRPVTRTGARVGDRLFVTGTLGGAALGVRTLVKRDGRPSMRRRDVAAVRAWAARRARIAAGAALARRGIATAMIDVSDGLLLDARRLCAASGVAARIDAAALPIATPLRALPPRAARDVALTGGEDYELLFTARPGAARRLARAGAVAGCRVTLIGDVVDGTGVAVIENGRPVAVRGSAGHEHFARRARRPRLISA